jgi:hypothetical protein
MRQAIPYLSVLLFMGTMMLYKGDYLNLYRLIVMSLLWIIVYISLHDAKQKPQ